MYKRAVRAMVRRNIDALNRGDIRPTLAAFAEGATLSFPGTNSWATQFVQREPGLVHQPTHRGREQIRVFLEHYVQVGVQMRPEAILVDGGPWRTRVAVQAQVWIPSDRGGLVYANRAVLLVLSRWGRIVTQEDYEDTQLAADLDSVLEERVARTAED